MRNGKRLFPALQGLWSAWPTYSGRLSIRHNFTIITLRKREWNKYEQTPPQLITCLENAHITKRYNNNL